MDKEVALLVIFDAKASRAPQFSRSLSKTQYLQFQSQSLAMRSRYKAHLSMGDLLRQIHTFQGGNTLKRKAQSQLPLADKRLEALYEGTMEPELIAMLTQADLSSRYHQIMEANLQALEDYVLCPYAGKVTLFQSIQASQGEHYGWDLLARGGVEIHRIPGTHLSMLEEPNVAGLAKVLKACIDSADRGLG
jgi:thioesterase domain-containing protein